MSRSNRSFRKTRAKMLEDPDFQFKSEWHRQKHFEAEKQIQENDEMFDAIGMIAAVCMVFVFIVLVAAYS